MPGAIRKVHLRNLLTHLRAKIDPTELGLDRPTGRGRRALGLGLSQAQLNYALRQYGIDAYARFERGDMDNPREDFLRAVAAALHMSEDEWRALWSYACGSQPPRSLYAEADQRLLDSWQRVLDQYPGIAYITNGAWDLLCHNARFAEMFESGVPPENTMEWMALSPEARRTLAQWEEGWAPLVLAQLRSAVSTYPDDRTLRRLDAMVRDDPLASPIYREDTLARSHPDGDVRPFRHPRYGPGHIRLNAAFPGGIAEARLVFADFFPGELNP